MESRIFEVPIGKVLTTGCKQIDGQSCAVGVAVVEVFLHVLEPFHLTEER